MTRNTFYLGIIAAVMTVAPAFAGLFGGGEPRAYKGTASEKAAYVEGTQKGLAPHTTGTLLLQDSKVLVFQHAKGSVSIPYQSISTSEVGPSRGRDAGPAYKVWNVHKRFGDKTRYLTVHYTENGAKNRLVFELAERSATLAAMQIEIAQGKRQGSVQATQGNEELWWGDHYWKTNRNADKWNKSGSDAPKSSSAPDR